ncbi:protein CutA isoform X2 [Chroicocephalus ridibundus]|uniref:protein CutA isoform X2 n=1 Tax=Chroicocephalus ridibundus TaxID=1192867 RepID=UPI002FDCE98C
MEWLSQRCPLLPAAQGCPRPGRGTLLLVVTLSLLMYPVLRSLALQLHSAITGSYVSGTHSIAFINCLNEQIAKDIARYFWKGQLEESTEILLVSDNSPRPENPHPRQPQPKGAAGWFGEDSTNLPEIGTVSRDPEHPPAGMAVMAEGGSLTLPLILPPQGAFHRKGPRKGCQAPAMLDGRSRTVNTGLLRPLYCSPGFCFVFSLSADSENKNIQNRRIVQLRQIHPPL